MSSLQVDVIGADGHVTVTFAPHPDHDALVRAEGAEVSDDLELVDVPAVIGALVDLHPQLFEDRRVDLTPDELDARVRDGRARVLSLAEVGAATAAAVVIDDEAAGYLLVERDGPDRLSGVTIRSLDVWQLICAVTHDTLPELEAEQRSRERTGRMVLTLVPLAATPRRRTVTIRGSLTRVAGATFRVRAGLRGPRSREGR